MNCHSLWPLSEVEMKSGKPIHRISVSDGNRDETMETIYSAASEIEGLKKFFIVLIKFYSGRAFA